MESLSAVSSLKSHASIACVIACIGWVVACDPKPSPECAAFQALSTNERLEEFLKYPTDKQIELYLCAMALKPPDRGLARRIADHGQGAITPLLEKLESTSDEGRQENLIYAFEVLSEEGHLRGRKDVIVRISSMVDNMKLAPIRANAAESLRKIQLNSGIKPFTYTK